VANSLKNDCENANTHAYGGVDTFTKEKEVGVETDQLGEETEVSGSHWK
jgi:hypothetical protein